MVSGFWTSHLVLLFQFLLFYKTCWMRMVCLVDVLSKLRDAQVAFGILFLCFA
jgi:hypothetical protein